MVSEFVLFNNIIIFVVLFGKIAKLLLSIMIWVEERKDSLIIIVTSCRVCTETKSSVIRLRNEFRNKHCYMASISILLKHIDN